MLQYWTMKFLPSTDREGVIESDIQPKGSIQRRNALPQSCATVRFGSGWLSRRIEKTRIG